MLNEKEKQAIEYLKENALVRLNKNNKIVAYGNSYKYYILKLLDKQQKEIERYKRIAEMNLKDGEEFKNEMCEHRCILKSEMKENYISKEAIVNVLNKYAHEPIEESIVINFYKELQKLLGE